MGSEDARRFREGKIYDVSKDKYVQGTTAKIKSSRDSKGRSVQHLERYSAKKGTAKQKKEGLNKKKRKPNLKLISLLIAASIGVGIAGFKISGALNPKPQKTVTQLQEKGIDTGLEEDTLEKMVKYDGYFADFDKDNAGELTDNDVIAMIDDISQLNEDAIADKIADLLGVSSDEVEYTIGHSDDVGPCPRIIVNNGEETQSYNVDKGIILGIGKKNSIPNKISNLILQTREYEGLKEELIEDRISKANAIQKLKGLYEKISEVAASEFSIDGKGNITVSEYDKPIQHNKKNDREDIEK